MFPYFLIQTSRYIIDDDVNGAQLNIDNNRIPFEDDILISSEQSTGPKDKNAIVSPDDSLRWPNAQIPYVISADYSIV